MRLRRRPRLRVFLLWKHGEVLGFSLRLNGEYVGYVPLRNTGVLAALADNVTLEHGGEVPTHPRPQSPSPGLV